MKSEHMTDEIKTQLNNLCRFSRDLSTHSSKVSGLIKDYNRYAFILFVVNPMHVEVGLSCLLGNH